MLGGYMNSAMKIRLATAADYPTLANIMFEAVRHGRSEYTEQQRHAWVPKVRGGRDWEERLARQTVFAAVDLTQLTGFMSLADDGYIDFAYVRPSLQGTGIFRSLYDATEAYARDAGMPRLWVHASLMAQRPFSAMGFQITKEEVVEIGDQSLRRFEMEKQMSAKTA